MKKNSTLFCGVLLTFSVPILLPYEANAMDTTRNGHLAIATAETTDSVSNLTQPTAILRSAADNADITLNMDYYKAGVILVRSDQDVIPENYVIVSEGYHIESMIYSSTGVITPDSIRDNHITGQYKIRYVLKDALNKDVYKDGQLVIRNLNIYFYDPTPVLDEIGKVNDKIKNGNFSNETEATEKINKVKEKVENPQSIPNIPALVNEVKNIGDTLTPKTDAENNDPVVKGVEVKQGDELPDEKVADGVDISKLPKGTTVTVINKPNTETPGNFEGTVLVTYPDGSSEEVKVPVKVTPKTDAEKYTPTANKETIAIGGKVDLTDNINNMNDLPKGTTVVDVTPTGAIDKDKAGTYEGTIEVRYPDSSKDTVKVPVEVVDNRTDAEKNTPTANKETIAIGGKVDLTDNVNNMNDLPKGTTVVDVTPTGAIDKDKAGTYEGTIEVRYPDGSKDTVKVSVEVVDNRTDAEKYTPTADKESIAIGGKVDLTDNVNNMNDLPKGTTVVDVTPTGAIDKDKAGTYEGTIEVRYPDGSKDTVKVPVEVIDNRTDAEKNTPTANKETIAIGGKVDLTDNVNNMNDLPKGTTVVDVTVPGTINTDKAGTYEGTIEVRYPDGSKDTVKVSVEVVDNRTDAEKYTPTADKESIAIGGKVDLTDNVNNMNDLPKGTTVVDVTPTGAIDKDKAGTYEGTIEVRYPDGSKDTVKVSVEVVDNRTDAEKYTPTADKESIAIGGKVDLTDNVNNMNDLPKGTTIVDVTPTGAIDKDKAGTYEGTIEVRYPDGSKDTVKVPVEVIDNRTDAEKNTPTANKETIAIGGKVDLTDNVNNMNDLPKGTTVVDVTVPGTINTDKAGTYEGTIEVRYPDGSKDTVKVPVEVVDNRTDAEKYTPTADKETIAIGGKVDLTDNVNNMNDLPKGTTVVDVTVPGTINTDKAGTYEGTIEVRYPDGSKDTVKVPVEVVDNRTDAEKNTPIANKETIAIGGKVDLTDNVNNMNDLPKGTTIVDVTPTGAIDKDKAGTYEGTIEVRYPDGSKDTVKVPVEVVDNRTDAEKYTPTADKESIAIGGKVDLTDNVNNMNDLPKGTTVVDVTVPGTINTDKAGTYEGTIEVRYPDGSKDTVKVPVEVVDNRTDAEKYTPTANKETIAIGGKVDLTDNVNNMNDLPKGTTVVDITAPGTINTDKAGTYEGTIEVRYPDGSKDTVKVPVEVVDNRTDAEKNTPTANKETIAVGGKVDLTDNVNNMNDLPKGTTVVDVTPTGAIDKDKAGTYEGTIEVRYPDGSKDIVKVPVEVVDNRTDAEKNTPTADKESIAIGGKVDLTDNVNNMNDLPKGTTVVDITAPGTINTDKAGTYEGTIEVRYPDGSKDTVKVPVEVVDNRTDAEKNTPTANKETIAVGGKVDLTDNVNNMNDLPKGTTVVDVTPTGAIDKDKAGTYEGTIEVRYPDGSKDIVKVPVDIVEKNKSGDSTPSIDDKQIIPEVINKGEPSDLTDNISGLPKGTKIEVVKPINSDQIGNQTGIVKVIFPNGSSTFVHIPAIVKDIPNTLDGERTDTKKVKTPQTSDKTNVSTFTLMLISSIGALAAIIKKRSKNKTE